MDSFGSMEGNKDDGNSSGIEKRASRVREWGGNIERNRGKRTKEKVEKARGRDKETERQQEREKDTMEEKKETR